MAETNGDKALPQKLGIDAGMTVTLLNAPNYFDFDLGDLPEDVEVNRDSDASPSEVFLVFADRSDEAQRAFERAVTYLPADGSIWIAWPKTSSDNESDLNEDVLRDMFQSSGMVSDQVCSIDETWSGLRFVVGEENRADWPAPTD